MKRILKKISSHRFVPDHPVITELGRFRIDFAEPEILLAIECHSKKWHGGLERGQSDITRHRALTLMGWTILYYSWEDVTLQPRHVFTEVRTIAYKLTLRMFDPDN